MKKSAKEILQMVGKNTNSKIKKIGKIDKYTAYEISQETGQYYDPNNFNLTVFKCNEDFTKVNLVESKCLNNSSYADCIKHIEKLKIK